MKWKILQPPPDPTSRPDLALLVHLTLLLHRPTLNLRPILHRRPRNGIGARTLLLDLPRPDKGMSHAVMIPLGFFTDFELPVVPILLNAYYAPQISGLRSCQLGRAVRALIDSYPADLRVVVIGSGGMWHTPRRPQAWLNEDFDRRGLACLERGAVAEWAEQFDRYVADPADPSQQLGGGQASGLPGSAGPQFGTRETLCWIAAAATVEGQPSVIVDYVPVYASPVGNGFAYCEQP